MFPLLENREKWGTRRVVIGMEEEGDRCGPPALNISNAIWTNGTPAAGTNWTASVVGINGSLYLTQIATPVLATIDQAEADSTSNEILNMAAQDLSTANVANVLYEGQKWAMAADGVAQLPSIARWGWSLYVDGSTITTLGLQGTAESANALSTVPTVAQGSFSISDWSGYPADIPQPDGPFRLLEGTEYQDARAMANSANRTLRRADPVSYMQKEIHEIQPVKFGGSPTDPANKVVLDPVVHRGATVWWNNLQRGIE